jgi:hypothetical protein
MRYGKIVTSAEATTSADAAIVGAATAAATIGTPGRGGVDAAIVAVVAKIE